MKMKLNYLVVSSPDVTELLLNLRLVSVSGTDVLIRWMRL